MSFESSNLQGAGPIFQIECLQSGRKNPAGPKLSKSQHYV